MIFEIDLEQKSISFSVPKKLYGREGLEISAHIFANRAEVLLGEDKSRYELTLRSKRKNVAASELEALGGEFSNELLNQEYRFVVSGFNRKISSLIVTQALLAARGGEEPLKTPEEEKSPEFQAALAAMSREAEEEIARTMPKKIPPQGAPLPPMEPNEFPEWLQDGVAPALPPASEDSSA